jgi:hypothetical protein
MFFFILLLIACVGTIIVLFSTGAIYI